MIILHIYTNLVASIPVAEIVQQKSNAVHGVPFLGLSVEVVFSRAACSELWFAALFFKILFHLF